MTVSYEAIAALPKIELHIHLEGTIDPELVQKLANRAGLKLPRPLDDLYQTHDLTAFLATLDWVCSLVNDAESARDIALNFGRYCAEQNIVYTEVIVNPTHWSGLPYAELFPALASAFDEVYERYKVDVRILPSLLRQQSLFEALALVRWMHQAALPRLVGLSVDGNEKASGRTARRFQPAYQLARQFGFGCTAHAGESSGAEGVRDAVNLLQVDRIDHGIRVIEDSTFTKHLAHKGITLNVCLSSNCTLLYDSIDQHPFNSLRAQGVKVTLNTDDPVVLNTTLSEEIYWASQELPLTLDDIKAMQLDAVNAAFCNAQTKHELLKRLTV